MNQSADERIVSIVEGAASVVPLAGATADPVSMEKYDVDAINKDHAVVLVGTRAMIVVENPKGPIQDRVRLMRPDSLQLWFANRFTWVPGSNGRDKRITWATAWRTDPRRRQYAGIEFFPNPDGALGTPGYYNLWSGFGVTPSPTGSYAIFKDHLLTNVCGGDSKLFEYLFAWFAHIIQRPREKIGVAIVLRGQMGTGKTKVGEVIGSLIPSHYFQVDDPRYITSNFNGHMGACLLLQAEEAIWAGDKQAEGRLKGLITSEYQMIEVKGIDPVRLPNYVRVLMTSNEDWVVPAGKGERRFLVLDVAPYAAQNHEYFGEMDTQLAAGGRQRLLHDLLNFDLGKINLRQAPKTDALLEQKLRSIDPCESWWHHVLKTGAPVRSMDSWPCRIATTELYDDYLRYVSDSGITRRLSQQAFGMKLMRLNPRIGKTRPLIETSEGRKRVWFYALPSLDECRSSFEKAIGQTIDWAPMTDKGADEDVAFANVAD